MELYAGTARSWEPFRNWRRCRLGLLVDNSPAAALAYTFNHRQAPYFTADLATLSAPLIESLADGQVDVLLGCPPCQGFSETGARNPNDPRNAHLARFAALGVALRPKAIAMENVPSVAASPQFAEFLHTLEQAGYIWTGGILNAALWGSAQSRQRLIVMALRQDLGFAPEFPAMTTHGGERKYYNYSNGAMCRIGTSPVELLGVTPAAARLRDGLPYQEKRLGSLEIPNVGEMLKGLPKIGTPAANALWHKAWPHKKETIERMAAVAEGGQWAEGLDHYQHAYARLHRKGLARTITTYFSNPGSGRFWHPVESRALSVREAARLQGFSDQFLIPPMLCREAATLVGNALDSALAGVVYRSIRDFLS